MHIEPDASLRAAWASYCDSLKAAGAEVLTRPTSLPALDLPEGIRMLTRLIRYGLEAGLEFANPAFPNFYHPSHETLKIMSDNPDTLHFMATVKDDLEYEITGTRGTVARIVFTTLARETNGAGLILQTSLASDQMQIDSDGSLRIYVSKRKQGLNWLPLWPGCQSLLVRAIFLDRDKEIAPVLKIRCLNRQTTPPLMTVASLESSLKAAALISAGTAKAMMQYGDQVRARGWVNRFGFDQALWGAGDPAALYHHGSWALREEEALLIEFTPPSCFFWNLQINNCWAESLDYLRYRIHVNKASAAVDHDGVVRIVIAHGDPGRPNWLNTVGHASGMMLARWIDSAHAPEIQCSIKPLRSLSSTEPQ